MLVDFIHFRSSEHQKKTTSSQLKQKKSEFRKTKDLKVYSLQVEFSEVLAEGR